MHEICFTAVEAPFVGGGGVRIDLAAPEEIGATRDQVSKIDRQPHTFQTDFHFRYLHMQHGRREQKRLAQKARAQKMPTPPGISSCSHIPQLLPQVSVERAANDWPSPVNFGMIKILPQFRSFSPACNGSLLDFHTFPWLHIRKCSTPGLMS